MEKDNITNLLDFNDEKYGKVTLALNKNLEEVCIINGKIEKCKDIIYDIKLRNHLCRDKKYNDILD